MNAAQVIYALTSKHIMGIVHMPTHMSMARPKYKIIQQTNTFLGIGNSNAFSLYSVGISSPRFVSS